MKRYLKVAHFFTWDASCGMDFDRGTYFDRGTWNVWMMDELRNGSSMARIRVRREPRPSPWTLLGANGPNAHARIIHDSVTVGLVFNRFTPIRTEFFGQGDVNER